MKRGVELLNEFLKMNHALNYAKNSLKSCFFANVGGDEEREEREGRERRGSV